MLNMRGGIPQRRTKLMSEINVTPMVDVMLVLLIVFMITAPLLTVGIKVDLPETSSDSISQKSEPVTVSITKEGLIYIQKAQIIKKDLPAKILAISDAGFEGRIFIRADKLANYGLVAEVMGSLNKAGFKSIGLITQQE